MPIRLTPLPYPYRALAPHLSESDIRTQRHFHRRYLTKLDHLLRDTPYRDSSLHQVVDLYAHPIASDANATAIFYNAAQAWNFEFQWRSLRPASRQSAPPEPLATQLERTFKSQDGFAQAFKAMAVRHFGRGWAWLVADRGGLRIMMTSNANTPTDAGVTPLLVVAIWEHAYNLDDQRRRSSYVAGIVDNLLDWDFANRNYQKAGMGKATTANTSPGHAYAWMRA